MEVSKLKKTGVMLFHPDIKESRVNNYLIDQIKDNAAVDIRDEYALYGDKDIDVDSEHEFLLSHERIVFQFPMYWYSSPSLLKKWEDVVLTYGWAYGSNGNRLHGKEIMIAVTAGAEGYSRNGKMNYTIHELLRPYQATSNLIGTKFLKPFVIEGASSISDKDLATSAKNYVEYLKNDKLNILGIKD